MIEREATRDHTERMLRGFGADVATEVTNEGHVITLRGQPELRPQTIAVPRDPSSVVTVAASLAGTRSAPKSRPASAAPRMWCTRPPRSRSTALPHTGH